MLVIYVSFHIAELYPVISSLLESKQCKSMSPEFVDVSGISKSIPQNSSEASGLSSFQLQMGNV